MSTPTRIMLGTRQRRVAAIVVTFASLGGATAALLWFARHQPAPVYSAEGFGGYVAAAPQATPERTPQAVTGNPLASRLPGGDTAKADAAAVSPRAAQDAYSAGRYRDAEALAARIVAAAAAKPSNPDAAAALPQRRWDAARARQIQAFAAARRHDLPLARARFALLKKEAAALPNKGRSQTPTPVGEAPAPSLEESAAYQHAVCTGALGDTAGAETEYVAFLKAYPDSPLIHAAVKRIARLHGGDVPKVAEAAWKRAMAVQQAHEQARQRDASLCAPECLAELLRRRGAAASVSLLAGEMKTSHEGTSLRALADVAGRHGLRARGLRLSHQGLLGQKLPAIALIVPGHFVLVERAHPLRVWVWDPDANGAGKPGPRQFSRREWANVWGGVALTLEAAGSGSNGDSKKRQTASR